MAFKSEEEYIDDPIILCDDEPIETRQLEIEKDGYFEILNSERQLHEALDLISNDEDEDFESDTEEYIQQCKNRKVQVKLVDCGQYSWYFKRYSEQIMKLTTEYVPDSGSDIDDDDDCYVVDDIPYSTQTIDLLSDVSPSKIKTRITVKNKEEIKKRAISLKSSAQIDLKRNIGLIGLTVKHKIPNLVEDATTIDKDAMVQEEENVLAVKKILDKLGTKLIPLTEASQNKLIKETPKKINTVISLTKEPETLLPKGVEVIENENNMPVINSSYHLCNVIEKDPKKPSENNVTVTEKFCQSNITVQVVRNYIQEKNTEIDTVPNEKKKLDKQENTVTDPKCTKFSSENITFTTEDKILEKPKKITSKLSIRSFIKKRKKTTTEKYPSSPILPSSTSKKQKHYKYNAEKDFIDLTNCSPKNSPTINNASDITIIDSRKQPDLGYSTKSDKNDTVLSQNVVAQGTKNNAVLLQCQSRQDDKTNLSSNKILSSIQEYNIDLPKTNIQSKQIPSSSCKKHSNSLSTNNMLYIPKGSLDNKTDLVTNNDQNKPIRSPNLEKTSSLNTNITIPNINKPSQPEGRVNKAYDFNINDQNKEIPTSDSMKPNSLNSNAISQEPHRCQKNNTKKSNSNATIKQNLPIKNAKARPYMRPNKMFNKPRGSLHNRANMYGNYVHSKQILLSDGTKTSYYLSPMQLQTYPVKNNNNYPVINKPGVLDRNAMPKESNPNLKQLYEPLDKNHQFGNKDKRNLLNNSNVASTINGSSTSYQSEINVQGPSKPNNVGDQTQGSSKPMKVGDHTQFHEGHLRHPLYPRFKNFLPRVPSKAYLIRPVVHTENPSGNASHRLENVIQNIHNMYQSNNLRPGMLNSLQNVQMNNEMSKPPQPMLLTQGIPVYIHNNYSFRGIDPRFNPVYNQSTNYPISNLNFTNEATNGRNQLDITKNKEATINPTLSKKPTINIDDTPVATRIEMQKELNKVTCDEPDVSIFVRDPRDQSNATPKHSTNFNTNSEPKQNLDIPLKGYSPPILPIPTYENVLDKVNEKFKENDNLKRRHSNNCNSVRDKKRKKYEFTCPKRWELHINNNVDAKGEHKKITIDEYKKRLYKGLNINV